MKTSRNNWVVAGLLIAVTGVYGQTRTWDGNGGADNSGNWSDASNWSDDNIPDTTAESASLPNVSGGTRTVTANGAYTINQVQMTQSTADAVNKLVLGGQLLTVGTTPLSLTPSAGTDRIVIDLNGQTLMSSNSASYYVKLNGTVNMGPGSLLDMKLAGNASGMVISNLGVWAQSASISRWVWAVSSGNTGGIGRRFSNAGVWSLSNKAAFLYVGPSYPPGFGLLTGCGNTGTITVRDGSILTFGTMTSTGHLDLGTNSVLGNAGSTLTIGSGGTFVASGTNAVVGAQTLLGGTATLNNGGTTFVGTNGTPAELVVKGEAAHLNNQSGGVLSALPESRIVVRFTGGSSSASFNNAGTFTQNNVVVQIDWAATGNNNGTRRITNAGNWSLQNGAQFQYVSSTGRPTGSGFGNMSGNANSGTLRLLSGSRMALQDMSNTGVLILGDNATLFTAQFNGLNQTLNNGAGGSVSVVGTNALLGYSNASGNFIIFNNGSGSAQGATLTIGDGTSSAECIIQGRQARLNNHPGNTVTVSRASSLRLTGTQGSSESWQNLGAYMMNSGVVVNAGAILLQPCHGGTVNPDNYGTYSIGTGTAATGEIRRLARTAGNSVYLQLAFNNRAGGTVTGLGLMSYTNMTGNAAANTLQLSNAGTVAPGAPTGTLELVNTAVTSADGTLAIQIDDAASFGKLKVSGVGAAFNLTGTSDTLNVSLVDGKYRWNGVSTFRIFEGGPVTGTFENEHWDGEPNDGFYTVTYGSNYIDIAVKAPPSGTVISIR